MPYHRRALLPIAAVLAVAAAALAYWFLWDRPFMEGVRLNPYQVDAIEIVRRGEGLLQQEIITIRDPALIRRTLAEWRRAPFLQESFPPKWEHLQGYPTFVRVRDGAFTELHADVYPGGSHEGDAAMLVNDRYHYLVPEPVRTLLTTDVERFAAGGRRVDVFLNGWRPLVVLEGEPHTAYFMEDGWGSELRAEPAASVTAALPDSVRYGGPNSIARLLTEGAGTFPAGTPIYEAEGYFFIRGMKESDVWGMLLPEGQAAHRLELDQGEEVGYWESYGVRYFVVRGEGGYSVFAARDPNASCRLVWDERQRRFISPCGAVEYGIDGRPSEPGAAPMIRWPSREWNGVLLFEYE
ncbi:hypothetical protein [Paenibacillus sp.]|uniref:hypothetical protein n=1 Tax=Paenibacillus sp. TaxID=58172 RepID=UPI002D651FB4|nr:hypothetical protein [Paenibacillus sp.]HZG83498.1 hypothetical protein [Paenibacillus sp.]